MNPTASRFAILMGSASILTLTSATANAQQVAQAQMAQTAPEVPEQVLITGSLIHGTAAVGVPVTNLGAQDFTQTGNVTIGDLFRTVPVANVSPGPVGTNSGGHQERETRVNIRGLDQTGPRSLLMVDGVRFPPQADGLCAIDPSIIPALALDRVDILADGASATYGSDAIAGVINVVLKRNFDGAVTLLHYQKPDNGGAQWQASQLWGRTWDGGDVTLTYEWTDEQPIPGNAHSKYTANFTPWGLDNRLPLGGSLPGTISTGAPSSALGTACTNCFVIPAGTGANFNPINSGLGPTGGSSAATLNFKSLSGGTANEFDVFNCSCAYEVAAQQRNSAVATIDQRLLPGVSFFFSGFYTNRRVQQLVAAGANQVTNDVSTLQVPTFNPYYPTNAPTNLRVSYDFAKEIPPFNPAHETSDRYHFGFNLDLPLGWSGQVYDSRSYDTNMYAQIGVINRNAASAALGWTIPATPASGTYPGIATYTKPATVPYLNLFCDPRAFQCNAKATLNYITGYRDLQDIYSIEEKGARFDGPLFDVPAGQVKAAVGGTYESDSVYLKRQNNIGQQNLVMQPLIDSEPYHVWAAFTQVDIPVFGDNLNLPLVRKLDIEGSFRHDSYSGTLRGSTNNPKIGFTWLVDDTAGLTIRGGWGTSFRFANAGEYSTVASDAVNDFGLPTSSSPIQLQCGSNGAPPPGSAAEVLFNAHIIDQSGKTGCTSAPAGVSQAGGPQLLLRSYVNGAGQSSSREGGVTLQPEKSTNMSIGFEIAPQLDLLRGLDIQATFYSVKINGVLTGFNNPTSGTFATPTERFHFIVPSDLGCPVTANANPASCAPFEAMVLHVLQDPGSAPGTAFLSSIYWINDGGTVNSGFLHVEGFDWNASYDWDWGDLGAWNTGITGTYYLHRYDQTVSGGTVIDDFNQNLAPNGGVPQNGVETLPRMNYRARLGWSNGSFSATGFLNYHSHYYHTQSSPPNVNFQCIATGSNVAGGTFPCAISNYSNIQPAWYSFDLSLGYSTGDTPELVYLKNLNLQLTIQNVLGIHPAFQYGPSNNGRTIAAFDILEPDFGRVFGVTLTKNW